jgi:hypothetical protein
MHINTKMALGGAALAASALASAYALYYSKRHLRCTTANEGKDQRSVENQLRDRIAQDYLSGIISPQHLDALRALTSKVSCTDSCLLIDS